MPQTPAPPIPEIPPIPDIVVSSGGPPEWVGIVAVVALIVGAVILYPLVRSLARRLEGRAIDADVRTELDALHHRVADLEQAEARLAELENRVEFSERLLTRQRDALPGPGGRE